jgi:hypothetical protein
MMKRLLLSLAAAALAAFALAAVRQAPEAQAVAATQIVATYKIKLKGDGWWRGSATAYRPERVNGTGLLVLARSVPDDGKVKVLIQADATGGLVDIATPTPDFSGSGVLVGDSLTVIGSGTATYVNAITLTFLKGGSRVLGHWFASFPPSDVAADSSDAGGVGMTFTGRRLNKRDDPVVTPTSIASRAAAR